MFIIHAVKLLSHDSNNERDKIYVSRVSVQGLPIKSDHDKSPQIIFKDNFFPKRVFFFFKKIKKQKNCAYTVTYRKCITNHDYTTRTYYHFLLKNTKAL